MHDPTTDPHEHLVDRLLATYAEEGPLQIHPGIDLPSFEEVRIVLHGVRELLFPGYAGHAMPQSHAGLRATISARLADTRLRLQRQVARGLHYRSKSTGDECRTCEQVASEIAGGFLAELPALRGKLLADVRAAYEGDPAASGADEIVFSYPGPWAILVYRVAHRLLERGAVIVPRMMTEVAHQDTGIDIHPGAEIGDGFFIDHGTGVVIGETTRIGDRVRIYQGVTLGALSLPRSKVRQLDGKKRHPTIEDDVIIYANATILGAQTVIGRGAVIGGNAFITESVPAGERRVAAPAEPGPAIA